MKERGTVFIASTVVYLNSSSFPATGCKTEHTWVSHTSSYVRNMLFYQKDSSSVSQHGLFLLSPATGIEYTLSMHLNGSLWKKQTCAKEVDTQQHTRSSQSAPTHGLLQVGLSRPPRHPSPCVGEPPVKAWQQPPSHLSQKAPSSNYQAWS